MTTPLDPGYAAAVARVKAAGVEPGDPLSMPIDRARALQDRYFEFLAQDAPPVASTRDFKLHGPAGAFTTRLYRPVDARSLPVIVFVRGAGWWAGNLESHDRTARLLALASGCAVCVVDYHRAPEYRFPTQIEEVLATVRWLRSEGAQEGLDAARLVLVGESAGANMAVLAALRLESETERGVSGLALFYGNYAAPSLETRAYSRWVWTQYLGVAPEQADAGAVPLKADVARLPPTWLGVGGADPLMGDTIQLAEKLRDAGVPHEVKVYPGLPHAFVMVSRFYEGAAAAVRDAASAAQRFVSK